MSSSSSYTISSSVISTSTTSHADLLPPEKDFDQDRTLRYKGVVRLHMQSTTNNYFDVKKQIQLECA